MSFINFLPGSRMIPDELVSSLSGLSALAAQPNAFWMKTMLSNTQERMAEGSLTLTQLGRMADAVSGGSLSIRSTESVWLLWGNLESFYLCVPSICCAMNFSC